MPGLPHVFRILSLGLLGWMLGASPGHAAVPGSMRLVLSVNTPEAECPPREAIARSVRKRLGYEAFGPKGKITVGVRIDRAEGRYIATIEHVSNEGESMGERRIESDSHKCSDLFEAVALTLALAAGPPTEQKWGPRPRKPEGPIRLPRAGMWTPYLFQVDDVMTASNSPDMAWNTGLMVTAGRGPLPGLALLAGWRLQWGMNGIDIDIEFHIPVPTEQREARIQTMQITLNPSYCYRGLVFGACVRSEFGVTMTEGLNLDDSNLQLSPNVAAGVGMDWNVLRKEDLYLEIRARLMVPLIRLRMVAGSEPLGQLPAVQGSLGLAGGMSF